MGTFLLTWKQRLTSVKWRMAYLQIGIIGALISKLVLDWKNKDFGTFIADISSPNGLVPDLTLLGVAFGVIHHSNEIAVADPAIKDVTGVASVKVGE